MYRVLDIRELNTKLWMIQVVVLYKAFIKFFTAWKNIENSWNAVDFREKIPHRLPHGGKSPMQKVYRVLDIATLNTKLWMVQVVVLYKAFIKFFTACKKIKNSWNDIDFSEKIPHGNPPWGKIPHGGFSKKCTGFSISQTLTQKMWMVQVFLSYKAFIKFFTACKKIKNWMSTIDFREKIPHGNPPWGIFKKCTGFSISQSLTQKCGWYTF